MTTQPTISFLPIFFQSPTNDTTIHFLPSDVTYQILGYLPTLTYARTCRAWNIYAQERKAQILKTLFQINKETSVLSAFGIPGTQPLTSALLPEVKKIVEKCKTHFPEAPLPECSASQIVMDTDRLRLFFDHVQKKTLVTALQEKAHIQPDTPFETAVTLIQEWIQSNEGQTLTNLSLISKNLICLPPELFQLKNLQTLTLSHNKLSSLPTEMGNLTALHNLYADDNQITSLPVQFEKLRALDMIYLNKNQLVFLPPQIGLLKELTYLNINENQLKFLPAEIGQLTNLEALYAEENQIVSVPYEIGHLPQLKVLAMTNNPLTDVSPEIEERFPNLRS